MEENLFWVIEAIKETSVTNSIMNLSHTFYVTADAKALFSILCSSGSIEIKMCRVQRPPLRPPTPSPPFPLFQLHLVGKHLSIQRVKQQIQWISSWLLQ